MMNTRDSWDKNTLFTESKLLCKVGKYEKWIYKKIKVFRLNGYSGRSLPIGRGWCIGDALQWV